MLFFVFVFLLVLFFRVFLLGFALRPRVRVLRAPVHWPGFFNSSYGTKVAALVLTSNHVYFLPCLVRLLWFCGSWSVSVVVDISLFDRSTVVAHKGGLEFGEFKE